MRMEPSKTTPQPRDVLADERIRRRWSQQEVADRIGTTHVNVSRWERGITKPNPYFRRKLCSLFGKTEQELDLAPPPEPPQSTPAVPASVEALYDPAIPPRPSIRLVGRDDELAQLKQ